MGEREDRHTYTGEVTMGPGFGRDIGNAMVTAGCMVAAAAAAIAVILWEVGKWLWRHLSVAWN